MILVTFSWANVDAQRVEERTLMLPQVPVDDDAVYLGDAVHVVVAGRSWDLSDPAQPKCNCHARKV